MLPARRERCWGLGISTKRPEWPTGYAMSYEEACAAAREENARRRAQGLDSLAFAACDPVQAALKWGDRALALRIVANGGDPCV